jgi:hypothetical protein
MHLWLHLSKDPADIFYIPFLSMAKLKVFFIRVELKQSMSRECQNTSVGYITLLYAYTSYDVMCMYPVKWVGYKNPFSNRFILSLSLRLFFSCVSICFIFSEFNWNSSIFDANLCVREWASEYRGTSEFEENSLYYQSEIESRHVWKAFSMFNVNIHHVGNIKEEMEKMEMEISIFY